MEASYIKLALGVEMENEPAEYVLPGTLAPLPPAVVLKEPGEDGAEPPKFTLTGSARAWT